MKPTRIDEKRKQMTDGKMTTKKKSRKTRAHNALADNKTDHQILSELEAEEEEVRAGRKEATSGFDSTLKKIEEKKQKLQDRMHVERHKIIMENIDVLLFLVPEHTHSVRQQVCSDEDPCNEMSTARMGLACNRCRLIVMKTETRVVDSEYGIEIEVIYTQARDR